MAYKAWYVKKNPGTRWDAVPGNLEKKREFKTYFLITPRVINDFFTFL